MALQKTPRLRVATLSCVRLLAVGMATIGLSGCTSTPTQTASQSSVSSAPNTTAASTATTPSTESSSEALRTNSSQPSPATREIDENAYLRWVAERITSISPRDLLRIGYGVCDDVRRGLDYEFVERNTDTALWPPNNPRPSSYLSEDWAGDRTDELIAAAMVHLCGMTNEQIAAFFGDRPE